MKTENPILSFPLYEPAGQKVEFSEADLLQHLLVVGTTGCGKTTLLTAAIRQLLAHPEKPGLLILDAKVDGLVEQVRKDARLAGRENDVAVFGPGGNVAFDLFGGLQSLQDVDRLTGRLMQSVDRFGRDNVYWAQASTAMISAALSLLVVSGRPINFESAINWMRLWFLNQDTPPEIRRVAETLTKRHKAHPALAGALDQVSLWPQMDPRTRSNLQSCLLNVLHPLLSPGAADSFSTDSRTGLNPAAAADGRICIISVQALREAELAKLFFRLAKQEFFDAVHVRQKPPHRLCGMVADEFPLVVTEEDVEQLATVRSKRCFVIAATQGLDSLTKRLGQVGGRAALNNLNNVVFMRCREAETAVFALLTLGSRRERVRPPRNSGWREGDLFSPAHRSYELDAPICPIGQLARLDQHQALIVHANGERTPHPVWFVPWFEIATPPAPEPTKPVITTAEHTADHVEKLMLQVGCRPLNPPLLVMTATTLGRNRQRKRVLKAASRFFLEKAAMVPEGLESLPTCWLAALPGILWGLRKPHWAKLPYFINRVAVENGLLLLHFEQEQPNPEQRLTSWDKIRIAVNAGLYPSRWRPLNRRLRVELRLTHPELRPLLDAPAQEMI
jgi:energy-coupling factor transporter ATP-binding protein EcfA2